MNPSWPRYWTQALAEVLGEALAQQWLRQVPPPPPGTFPTGLLALMAQTFGPRAGAGVASRVGEALFRHWLADRRPQGAWRLLPLPRRVTTGLTWLTQDLALAWGGAFQVRAQDQGWRIVSRLPIPAPWSPLACLLWWGFFQEALYWLTARVYPLETCEEASAPCCLAVPAHPLY